MALNFADLFEHAADAFADRTAVACADRQVTYRELDERTSRLAHHLAGLGIGPGDHVGLYARNSIEALETLIAACKLRAAAVNINYRYVENELNYMFADSDLTALVYDRRLAPLVAAAAPAAPGLRALVEIDDGSEAAPTTPGATEYVAALAAASPARDFPARSGDDVYIIYTGGTTGYPKGVMWRHEDIWRTLGGGIDFITGEPLPDEWEQSRKGLENGEFVKLCAAPLIHGNAQVAALAGLFAGETIVLLPAFDAREIWLAVQRHQVNVLVIIGDAMARPLIEAYAEGDYDASSLVAVSSSAALFSPAVKDACAKALPDAVITEAIGSTETGFAGISFVSAGEPHRGGPTVMAGPDVIVLGDDGQPAAPGTVGRLARGGHVPLGYYKDPARTAAMFAEVDGKRYAVPGDMARVEDDGTVTLLGRGNTCVNTGGEKVFPEEVDGALKSHPGVFDALVIGVPDERLGQRVAALVQLRPGAAADLGALQEHVRRRALADGAPVSAR
jgi:acyl-CoA synthetase (AMP-forming)/AMP-acid ligase II